MRKLSALLAAVLLIVSGSLSPAEVTVDVFFKSLQRHGDWIETAEYGYVWHPSDVQEHWRPYTAGSWAFTDAGWTWVSEEPFGWATYHYGRWIELDDVGWAWVPDTEWGPAWVSWRRGPKHVGWAPLPPEASFLRTVGIKAWSDAYYDVGPGCYSFVEVRNFGSPTLATVILPRSQNLAVIRETRNITNLTVVNDLIFNGGPEFDVIVRESVQPIRRFKLERRTDLGADSGQLGTFRPKIAGEALQFVAPEVRYVEDVRPARITRVMEKVRAERGWAELQGRDQEEQWRAAIKKEAPQLPAELPAKPEFRPLAERKTAGDSEIAPVEEGEEAGTPEDVQEPANAGAEGKVKAASQRR